MLRWLFRLALHLYPSEFRRTYGKEMEQVFSDSIDEASRTGRLPSLLLGVTTDLLSAVARERWQVTDRIALALWLSAIPLGLAIGYVDSHTSEVQVAVAFILAASFVFGMARPRKAWRWALAVGASIPAYYIVGSALGYHLPPVQPNMFATCIAFIPALIGAYAGAGFSFALSEVSR